MSTPAPLATPAPHATRPPRIVVHGDDLDAQEALRRIARVEILRTRIRHAASNPPKGIEVTGEWGAIHGQHRLAIRSTTTRLDALLARMSILAYDVRRLLPMRRGAASAMETHPRHDPRRSIDVDLAVRPGCFEMRDNTQRPGLHVVLSGTPIIAGDAPEKIDAALTILDHLVEDLRTIAEGRSVTHHDALTALRVTADAMGRHADVRSVRGIVAHFARDDQPTYARFVGSELGRPLLEAPSDPLVAHGVRFVLIESREAGCIDIGSVGTVENRSMSTMETLRAMPVHARIVDLARSLGCIPS